MRRDIMIGITGGPSRGWTRRSSSAAPGLVTLAPQPSSLAPPRRQVSRCIEDGQVPARAVSMLYSFRLGTNPSPLPVDPPTLSVQCTGGGSMDTTPFSPSLPPSSSDHLVTHTAGGRLNMGDRRDVIGAVLAERRSTLHLVWSRQ